MRSRRRSGVAGGHRPGAGTLPGSALVDLFVTLHSLPRISRISVGHPVVGNGFFSNFLCALEGMAPVWEHARALANYCMAISVAVVPADVRLRVRETLERRPYVAESDGPELPLRDSTA